MPMTGDAWNHDPISDQSWGEGRQMSLTMSRKTLKLFDLDVKVAMMRMAVIE